MICFLFLCVCGCVCVGVWMKKFSFEKYREEGKVCKLGKKMKTLIFENGRFSGHFVLDKNNCFLEEKMFFSKQELLLFCFLKKNVFWEIFFREIIFKNFKKVFPIKHLRKFLFNFFEKQFSKKTFFFKTKENAFKKKQSAFLLM